MSQNAQTVRCSLSLVNAGEFEAAMELLAPDVEYVNPPYAVEPGTRHGHDGFAAAARAQLDVYTDITVTEPELREVGDRVLVTAKLTARSRGNAVPIEAERGYVFDLRDGKITRFAWFSDPAEALEAVGLED